RGEFDGAAASPGPQGERVVIEHVRQVARRGGCDESHELRARLALRQLRKARERRSLGEDRNDDGLALARLLESGGCERRLESAPAPGVTRQQRCAPGPF